MSTSKSEQPLHASQTEDSRRAIIKSTTILSLGTLTSRILGFFRDVILARLLGTSMMADAFYVAFRIPNLFRDLVGEGATNAAMVPVLAEYKGKENKDAFWSFVSALFLVGLIILSVITILGVVFTPIIVRVMVPGFMADAQKLELTVRLTKILFPYLVFIGLTAYSMGVLFTMRSFVVPAFSPCLLNIAMIVSALLSQNMAEPVLGLAVGVLIGGLLQFAVQIRPLMKAGVQFKWPRTFRHEGIKKIGRLLIPRMLGSGVYQLTVLVDTFCASLSAIVGAGGISAIYFSNRLIQFPMGVFSVAMASAVLPTLSGMAQRKDTKSLKKIITFSLENIFFIMCPTTITLLLLAHPITRILFEGGKFDAYSTEITAWALSFYAIGLFSFGGIKILVTAFHALQDTKTPVKVSALCLVINAALNFILMVPLKVGGIALASAIAGTIDFLILFYVINQRLGGLDKGLFGYLLRVMCAAGVVGIYEYWAWQHFIMFPEWMRLGLIGMTGLTLYLGMCLALNIEQAKKICLWATQKRSV